jgi:hypothetical protein
MVQAKPLILASSLMLGLFAAASPALADGAAPAPIKRAQTVSGSLTNSGGGGTVSYTFTGDGNAMPLTATFNGAGVSRQTAFVNVYGPTGLFDSPRVDTSTGVASSSFATSAGETYTVVLAIYGAATQANYTLSLAPPTS